MKIAILGYGSQGKSAYNYWQKGNDITICDSNPDIQLPSRVEYQLGPDYLENLERYDLIIRSPSIHPRDIVAANNDRITRKITTVTEEFFRNCPAKIIGVTGTKGKGTTSTLITKILETAGKTVHLGGNIGIPPLDMLKNEIKSTDIVVLELANFQLIDLGVSPSIAVCLMVAPEHLDWHKDIDEYISAKQNLFRYQKSEDLAIYNRQNDLSTVVAEVSPALKMSYAVPPLDSEPADKNGAYVLGDWIYVDDEKICAVNGVALLGRHNLENVCAAIMATWKLIDYNPEIIKTAVKQFKGMPYRLELVRKVNGVKYYNDSFGTTPETAIVAIKAIKEPKILIVGGSDKKSNYSELAKTIKENNVKQVIQIGKMGPILAEELQKIGYTNLVAGGETMNDIVEMASKHASAGDAVLLSTACASFDMFKNYKDRGDQFNTAVENLS